MDHSQVERRRVCFVSLEIYPTAPGGAGILIRHTANVLLRDGYEILLLLDIAVHQFKLFRDEHRLAYPFPERVHAFSVSELCGDVEGDAPRGPDDEYGRSIRISRALEVLLSRERIDLVEFYDYCGPAWHFLATPHAAKTRTAIRLHNTIELIDRKVRNPLSRSRLFHYAMERGQIALADGLLHPGPRYFAQEIVSLYPEARDGRQLDSSPVFYPLGDVSRAADPRDVLFYGRLSTFKGLDTFLRGAVAALESLAFAHWLGSFVVVGPEETVASSLTLGEMKAVIPDRHRERFRFLGRLEHDRLIKLLPDVAFAAFANRMESFCYAAHEVHNAGVPIIVNDAPAFRDFFENEHSALFFDGTAKGLGAAMKSLAANPELRARLSAFGAARAESYLVNRYDAHLAQIKRRRSVDATAPKITALIFSDGNPDAEASTLSSIEGVCANALVLRPDRERGYLISGTRFIAEAVGRADAIADLEPVGGAVIGLRAGDRVQPDWLTEATTLLGQDDKVGAVGCWHEGLAGVEASPANLLPEAALLDRMGLRQLIRIRHDLLFSEIAAEMKASGEAGLVFAARAQGQVVLESPRVGVDIRNARATPLFDLDASISVDFDRINPDFFALQNVLGVEIGRTGVVARRSTALSQPGELAAAVSQQRCTIRARPDLQPGEVWILRVHARDGALRTPWSAITFTGTWEARRNAHAIAEAQVCPWWGEGSFIADSGATFELLRGPYCGMCEIIYGGVRTLVNLRTSDIQSVRLRLSDILGITQVADIVGSRPQSGHLSGYLDIARPRSASDGKIIAVADGGSWLMARTALAAGPLQRLSIADLAGMPGGILAAAERMTRSARNGELDGLVISASSEASLELLDTLNRACSPLAITAVLAPDASGVDGQQQYAADVAVIGRLHRIVRDRPQTFTIASPDGGLLPAFASMGARTLKLAPFPRVPRLDAAARGAVSFCVLRGSRIVPVRTHLLAAALLLRARLDPTARILLPLDDEHLLSVAQELGAQNIQRYRRLDDVAPEPGERRLALGVFPDKETPWELECAAGLGCLPLVGPADLWGEAAPGLQIAYWEDAAAIAEVGEAALKNWQNACGVAMRAAYRARETALAQAGELLELRAQLDLVPADQEPLTTDAGGA